MTAPADDPQRQEWEAWCVEQVTHGRCPYSGATIRACVSSGMCDCFEFPEADHALGVAD